MADNWFLALGKRVSDEGIEAGIDLCSEWNLDRMTSWIKIIEIARYMEKDQPVRAIDLAETLVGRDNQIAKYMLLATLGTHAN